jgi:hypothetical protein
MDDDMAVEEEPSGAEKSDTEPAEASVSIRLDFVGAGD